MTRLHRSSDGCAVVALSGLQSHVLPPKSTKQWSRRAVATGGNPHA